MRSSLRSYALLVGRDRDSEEGANRDRSGGKRTFFYGSLAVFVSHSRLASHTRVRVRARSRARARVRVYRRSSVTRARVHARRSSLREMLIGGKARSGQKPAHRVQGLCVFLFRSLLPDVCIYVRARPRALCLTEVPEIPDLANA